MEKTNKYGSAADKALSFEELEYLRYNIQDHRNRVILIGTAFGGMRITELIQCRKAWCRWDTLEANGEKKRVLAIDIPIEDKNIVNKHMKDWRIKTYNKWKVSGQLKRTTYILDETLATEFMLFYNERPDGISTLFKSKKEKSIARNISSYIISVIFKDVLLRFHMENDLTKEKALELRPKLSAHPLRATYENLLFYKYKVSIDIAAELLGHSPEIARQHYLSNSTGNIKNKLAQELIGRI